MTTMKFVAAVAAALFALVSSAAAHPEFIYRFDAASAAGIEGAIRFKYAGEDSSVAAISAALDFSRLDQRAIQTFDPKCVVPVTEFKWHIHTRWSVYQRSASFKQCSLAATGNHYDPLFACSPDSEHIDSPKCKARAAEYACTPKRFALDPRSCEKGDLSGKFGNLVLNDEKKATGKWVDKHAPLPSEHRPSWSIVLHAVCGNHATRVACAVEEKA